MPAYLKIENPGVAPAESFTLIGVSTKNTSRDIGKYGSGTKNGLAVLLRLDNPPIVFAGNLRMDFGAERKIMDDGIRRQTYDQIYVKYSGRDDYGKTRNSTEDLGFSLTYGQHDWKNNVGMAGREFVSNAIDRANDQGAYEYEQELIARGESGIYEKVEEYRKTATDWRNAKIEIVEENQVRAKKGHTRVFIKLTDSVLNFYNNIGKWFLHFSEPENLNKAILPKANRNLSIDRKTAVIYRRGVLVREFEATTDASLFDYNLHDLPIDEARRINDWDAMYHAGVAVANADIEGLKTLLSSFQCGKFWEHQFSSNSFQSLSKEQKSNWNAAFNLTYGSKGVMTTKESDTQILEAKGYRKVEVPETYLNAARGIGIATPDKVLSEDELNGREIVETTNDAQLVFDAVWNILEELGETKEKDKPFIKCYKNISINGGQSANGFWKPGEKGIHVNFDICNPNIDCARHASFDLIRVITHELGHYITNGTDLSLDHTDFAFRVAARLIMMLI